MSTLRERSPMSYLLALPAGLWMLGALVVPTLFIAWVSFWDSRTFSLESPLGWGNYARFFAQATYRGLLLDSVLQAALLMAITAPLGYSIAYFIVAKVRRPGLQIALFMLLLVPFWTSVLIRTIAWIPFLGVNGVINQALTAIGAVDRPIEAFLFTRTGITMAQVSLYTLFAAGPVVYVLRDVPQSLLEAAKSLGASPFHVFWRITFPLTLPGVVIGQILVFLNVMADFATAAAIGGNKHVFLGNLVIMSYDSGQLPFASVIAVLLMLCMLAGVAGLLKVVDVRRLGIV